VVAKITEKKGGTEKKPWTLYSVYVAEPGSEKTHRLGTFDAKLMEVAREHATAGEEVRFTFERTAKGDNLTGIEAVDAAPED
jgi:hypothetical protein